MGALRKKWGISRQIRLCEKAARVPTRARLERPGPISLRYGRVTRTRTNFCGVPGGPSGGLMRTVTVTLSPVGVVLTASTSVPSMIQVPSAVPVWISYTRPSAAASSRRR